MRSCTLWLNPTIIVSCINPDGVLAADPGQAFNCLNLHMKRVQVPYHWPANYPRHLRLANTWGIWKYNLEVLFQSAYRQQFSLDTPLIRAHRWKYSSLRWGNFLYFTSFRSKCAFHTWPRSAANFHELHEFVEMVQPALDLRFSF